MLLFAVNMEGMKSLLPNTKVRSGGNPGTAPGVYTLTVTGTCSSDLGNLTFSINLTLNVQ